MRTQFPPIRKQEKWARSDKEKTVVFTAHLFKVFEPYLHEIAIEEENRLLSDANTLAKMVVSARPFTVKMRTAIRILNLKKAPDYDLITNQLLQQLSEKGIKFITQLYKAKLRQDFLPRQWKIAQIIMIQKPGKSAEFAESYRTISLLLVLSKLFEKRLLLQGCL